MFGMGEGMDGKHYELIVDDVRLLYMYVGKGLI